MNKTVQKAIRAEYAVLRTPLTLLDERVLPRLGGSSRLRTTVGRGISKLDEVAARLLEPAPAASRPPTSPQAEEIPADEVEELAEDLLEQQEQEHNLVGELAEDDELRRVQAELMAKHRVEERHETGH
jgi:hypothetical protein